jgi:hypothetical protein
MFEVEIAKYVDHVRQDYKEWMSKSDTNPTYIEKMLGEFDARVKITEGKTYIKIVTRGTVHAFIVKEAGGKFRSGDILKAAGYSAPAKNFARGNLIDGNFMNITWTGA